MSWQKHLREVILAGGALAATACSSAGSASGVASDGGTAEGSGADAQTVDGPNFCCNANPDPCCQHQYCGGELTAECASKLACQADGGTWVNFSGCSYGDAGPGDGGAGDAPVDAPDDAPADGSR